MTKTTLLLTSALCALSGLAFAGAASAQTAAPTATATGNSATEVGAVVVTAEKRSQNLQKVPVAVTAFTSSMRDKVGIETLQDMTNFTPGMTYSSSLDHLYVRGEGRQSANLGADAGVATYVDGFYTPDPVIGIDPPLFSQNVEVLRGPQGTLSGRNGIGGALLITSTRPTSTPYAEARLTVENYGYTDVEGAVSGPLADGLNARVAGWWRNQTQGYFKNVSGGPTEGGVVDDYHIEASTTARLGDNVDLFVRAFAFHTNDRGGPGARSGYSPDPLYTGLYDTNSSLYFNPAYAFGGTARNVTTLTGVPGVTPGVLTQNPAIGNPRDFMAETPQQFNTHDAENINYVATWHLDGMDLRYTGGYQQYTYDQKTSPQLGTVGIQETDVSSFLIPLTVNPTCVGGAAGCLQVNPSGLAFHYEQKEAWYSHELVLQSTGHGPLKWTAGLLYYHEQYSNPITLSNPAQSQLAAPCELTLPQLGSLLSATPGAVPAGASAQCPAGAAIGVVPAPLNPSYDLVDQNYNFTEVSKAAFGQVDYQINDQFQLTGGLRYTDDTKGGTEYNRTVDFGGSALGLYAAFIDPTKFGPITPALDITPVLCAIQATYPAKGVTSPCVVNTTTGVASRGLGGSSNAVTGTAGIQWTPDSSTLAFLRYSRGYKELGLNGGFLATVAYVAPEYVNDFELGYKKSFGHNLVIDADVFYEDFTNFQDQITIQLPSGLSDSFVSIPKARSAGFELETIWTPVENLLLNLSYAYDDTSFPNKCPSQAAAAAGNPNCFYDAAFSTTVAQSANGEMPNTPRNKVSVVGQYSWVFDPGRLTLAGTYIWRDVQYGSIFKTAWYEAPSWSQVNLRLTWAGRGDRYEVALFGDNVFNTLGYASGASAYAEGAGQTKYYTVNPPATYGVELHYKFF